MAEEQELTTNEGQEQIPESESESFKQFFEKLYKLEPDVRAKIEENNRTKSSERILLTPTEARSRLGFSQEKTITLMRHGVIPSFRIGKNGLRTSIHRLEEFAEKLTASDFPSNFTKEQRKILQKEEFLDKFHKEG